MEVAIHLPDDVAAAVPSDDLPHHLVEQIALEGYQDGWLSEEQVRRLLGYETRLEVHGFLKDHGVPLQSACVLEAGSSQVRTRMAGARRKSGPLWLTHSEPISST
jgi:hypothetical protein